MRHIKLLIDAMKHFSDGTSFMAMKQGVLQMSHAPHFFMTGFSEWLAFWEWCAHFAKLFPDRVAETTVCNCWPADGMHWMQCIMLKDLELLGMVQSLKGGFCEDEKNM